MIKKQTDETEVFDIVVDSKRKEVISWLTKKYTNLSYDEAEDIFQEGSIVLWHKAIENPALTVKDLTCMMKVICRNIFTHQLSKKHGTTSVAFEEAMYPQEKVVEGDFGFIPFQIVEKQRKECVYDEIDRLKPSDRELMMLYLENVHMDEIARRLGLKNQQVAKNKKRKIVARLCEVINGQALDACPFFLYPSHGSYIKAAGSYNTRKKVTVLDFSVLPLHPENKTAKIMNNKKTIITSALSSLAALTMLSLFVWIISPAAIWAAITGKPTTGSHHGGRFLAMNITADGIDVSHHNNDIDWQKVGKHETIKFVYIKATEGGSYVDKNFLKNATEARRNGLDVGAYLFFRKGVSPKKQFRNFCRIVDKSGCNMVPVIDVEYLGIKGMPKDKLQKNVTELSRLLERHYGKKPVIYCQEYVYNNCLAKTMLNNPVWFANLQYHPWLKSHKGCIWQYSERGNVDGISGHVDLNHLEKDMTLAELRL